MFKNQLIELLSLGIVDKSNDEDINFLLSLNQKEVNILLENKKRAKYLYRFMKKYKDNKCYEIIIKKISEEKDKKIVEQFMRLVENQILIDSERYEFALIKSLEIKDENLFMAFNELACDPDLLKSKYYEFALTKSLEIKDNDLFKAFVALTLFCPSDLPYYEFVITQALKIKDAQLLREFIGLAINKKIIDSPYYKFVITQASEIKDINLLEKFIILATVDESLINSKDYKFALTKASKIKDIRLLDFFVGKHNVILSVPNFRDNINDIFINDIGQDITSSSIIQRVIRSDLKIDKISFMRSVLRVQDERILEKILCITMSCYKEFTESEIDLVFNSVIKILKIKNDEVVLELLDDISWELIKEENIKNFGVFEPKIEEIINKRNVVNLIATSTNEQITKRLNDLSDDEDITPNTFVKKIKM